MDRPQLSASYLDGLRRQAVLWQGRGGPGELRRKATGDAAVPAGGAGLRRHSSEHGACASRTDVFLGHCAQMDIETSDVPGALSLLQEAGDYDPVLR